jgi:hypothetical protein
VKLFTPDGPCTWLFTELDPNDPDIIFGLSDVGAGTPELECVRGSLGLRVERDLFFVADKPLSAYTKQAIARGRIVA